MNKVILILSTITFLNADLAFGEYHDDQARHQEEMQREQELEDLKRIASSLERQERIMKRQSNEAHARKHSKY